MPIEPNEVYSPDETAALCGFPWEGLIEIPGSVAWQELHPDLRCDQCFERDGLPLGDPDATYRFDDS